ncbi:MAG: sensor N-terminal transmembrane domain-containing protein [Planktomarina sp.]
MSATSDIDVRDLKSVRAAAGRSSDSEDLVLGDEWVAPDSHVDREMRINRENRGFISINRSPLARKIVMFNLIALMVLVAGVLYMNPSRDSLAYQRATTMVSEARLVADVIEAEMPKTAPVNFQTGDGIDIQETIEDIDLRAGVEMLVFDLRGTLQGSVIGSEATSPGDVDGLNRDLGSTVLTDLLNKMWDLLSGLQTPPLADNIPATTSERVFPLVSAAADGRTQVGKLRDSADNIIFAVAVPIKQGNQIVGVAALSTAAGEIDLLVRQEREQVLQVFVIALLVSVVLSLVLATTIANPISDLASAAELGRQRNSQKTAVGRIRIPDLTARPDEVGRLSGALRGMVSALYDRIDGNEQFAADVAHEIKNPLASLQSAVGTMRVAKRDDQREKLLDVIEHDVKRLDRLVSDISNASRLDSELVKEEEETFDLLYMLGNLTQYLGEDAKMKGIDFVQDLPEGPMMVDGLEARLAQVFVNLITNAISFCAEGDAIRVWCRQRDNRVLVVVEDTGPGIPDEALAKIFKRFYSERPEGQFGNNSGLGLAISKQIVEAHGGVVWAENIRPTDADPGSDPFGARFVVGLPV